jgi:indole-3-glycerol phosphate synthase
VTFLADILRRKAGEVAAGKAARPERELRAAAAAAPPPRSLFGTLSARGGPVRIVAEVKRKSPSAGAIDSSLDAPAQARRYAGAGAAAVSVLTDGPGFGGSLRDLVAVREAVPLPVLRKDFVVDRWQLWEARAAGADAALLIAAALPGDALRRLQDDCREIGVEALVEVHDEREAEAALASGALLVGVNNRDLRSFQVDLAAGERVLPLLPAGVKAVAESGVRGPAEVRRLRAAGAANFLVGEALVRAADPGELLRRMTEAG